MIWTRWARKYKPLRTWYQVNFCSVSCFGTQQLDIRRGFEYMVVFPSHLRQRQQSKDQIMKSAWEKVCSWGSFQSEDVIEIIKISELNRKLIKSFIYTGWNDKIFALEKMTWFHFRLIKTGFLFLFFFFFLLQTII